jgi:hypothetical protein
MTKFYQHYVQEILIHFEIISSNVKIIQIKTLKKQVSVRNYLVTLRSAVS